jgi:glycosyltransferase involved in cell wall biosynthesis
VARARRIHAAADFFLHPARFDAFGGGTLYAMAAGVPAVASDGAGSAVDRIRDGENGLLYPREDVSALADRIRRMLRDDEARREMGRRARLTAEEWPPERGARLLYAALGGEDAA